MSTLEDRPWEQPGELRRDAEPHRGRILILLAAATSVSGILTPFLPILFCKFPLPYRHDLCFLIMLVLSGAGLLVGLTTWVMARADLSKMQTGMMDRHGKALTEEAKNWNFSGLLLNLALFLFAAAVVAVRLTA